LLTVSADLNWEASKHARCYRVTVAETPELTPAIAYEIWFFWNLLVIFHWLV
jgi:hypothetical protein